MTDQQPLTEQMFHCGHSRAELALLGESRWGIKHLTWFVSSYPLGSGMTKEQIDAVIVRSCDNWSKVCGLTFSRSATLGSANIRISTVRGRRGGGDGKLGMLAFCYLPTGQNFNGSLDLVFDGDEDWEDDPNGNGIEMENVLTHELGHGIGQSHTNIQRQLMNPTYSRQIRVPQSNDIRVAVDSYGPPSALPAPTPTPPPLPPSGAVLCKVQIGNVVYGAELKPLSGAAKVEFNE